MDFRGKSIEVITKELTDKLAPYLISRGDAKEKRSIQKQIELQAKIFHDETTVEIKNKTMLEIFDHLDYYGSIESTNIESADDVIDAVYVHFLVELVCVTAKQGSVASKLFENWGRFDTSCNFFKEQASELIGLMVIIADSAKEDSSVRTDRTATMNFSQRECVYEEVLEDTRTVKKYKYRNIISDQLNHTLFDFAEYALWDIYMHGRSKENLIYLRECLSKESEFVGSPASGRTELKWQTKGLIAAGTIRELALMGGRSNRSKFSCSALALLLQTFKECSPEKCAFYLARPALKLNQIMVQRLDNESANSEENKVAVQHLVAEEMSMAFTFVLLARCGLMNFGPYKGTNWNKYGDMKRVQQLVSPFWSSFEEYMADEKNDKSFGESFFAATDIDDKNEIVKNEDETEIAPCSQINKGLSDSKKSEFVRYVKAFERFGLNMSESEYVGMNTKNESEIKHKIAESRIENISSKIKIYPTNLATSPSDLLPLCEAGIFNSAFIEKVAIAPARQFTEMVDMEVPVLGLATYVYLAECQAGRWNKDKYIENSWSDKAKEGTQLLPRVFSRQFRYNYVKNALLTLVLNDKKAAAFHLFEEILIPEMLPVLLEFGDLKLANRRLKLWDFLFPKRLYLELTKLLGNTMTVEDPKKWTDDAAFAKTVEEEKNKKSEDEKIEVLGLELMPAPEGDLTTKLLQASLLFKCERAMIDATTDVPHERNLKTDISRRNLEYYYAEILKEGVESYDPMCGIVMRTFKKDVDRELRAIYEIYKRLTDLSATVPQTAYDDVVDLETGEFLAESDSPLKNLSPEISQPFAELHALSKHAEKRKARFVASVSMILSLVFGNEVVMPKLSFDPSSRSAKAKLAADAVEEKGANGNGLTDDKKSSNSKNFTLNAAALEAHDKIMPPLDEEAARRECANLLEKAIEKKDGEYGVKGGAKKFDKKSQDDEKVIPEEYSLGNTKKIQVSATHGSETLGMALNICRILCGKTGKTAASPDLYVKTLLGGSQFDSDFKAQAYSNRDALFEQVDKHLSELAKTIDLEATLSKSKNEAEKGMDENRLESLKMMLNFTRTALTDLPKEGK